MVKSIEVSEIKEYPTFAQALTAAKEAQTNAPTLEYRAAQTRRSFKDKEIIGYIRAKSAGYVKSEADAKAAAKAKKQAARTDAPEACDALRHNSAEMASVRGGEIKAEFADFVNMGEYAQIYADRAASINASLKAIMQAEKASKPKQARKPRKQAKQTAPLEMPAIVQ